MPVTVIGTLQDVARFHFKFLFEGLRRQVAYLNGNYDYGARMVRAIQLELGGSN